MITARHYLDWAATAIPDSVNLDKVASVNIYGNPSAQNTEGRLAREALESARFRCASVLGVEPEKLYFTSGGTESNALVLHSLLLGTAKAKILYSGIEHPSVRENCLRLERLGLSRSAMAVERDGRVSVESLSRALEKHPDTRFAAIMWINNETGALMDLKALAERLNANRGRPQIHLHSDLVQAIGKVPVELKYLDSASISAHKLGGPRGLGLLYLKKPLEPLYVGGGQEGGVRPGTENVPGALALAELIERRSKPETVKVEAEKAAQRFKYLIGRIKKIPRCILIPEDREDEDERFSPWILQLRFKGLPGAVMVRALDDTGVAVSTGAACSSRSSRRPVLEAMGLDTEASLEGFRISQGWSTTESDFDALLWGVEKTLSTL
jgi:cysteine desulfurase